MIRRLVLIAVTAAMAAAPVAAHAAPSRLPAPVATESEALRGNPTLAVVLIAVVLGLLILAATEGDDPVSP